MTDEGSQNDSNDGCGCWPTGLFILLVVGIIGSFFSTSLDLENEEEVYEHLQEHHHFECPENIFGNGPQVTSFLLFTSKKRCEMYTYVNGEKEAYESYSYDLGEVSNGELEIEMGGSSYEFVLKDNGNIFMRDAGESFLFKPKESDS